MSRNEVLQLFDGYSIVKDEKFMKANCSVTLVKGSNKIILVNLLNIPKFPIKSLNSILV